MENQEDGPMHECREKILHNFSDFMTRIAKFEELVSVGNRFLVGFQQGLEYVQRPPIEKKSQLVEGIIRANETKRLVSYTEAGFKNTSDGIRNINKSKCLVDELASLLDDASAVVQTATYSLPCTLDRDINYDLESSATSTEREEVPSCVPKPELTDIATMMAVIFTMVKKDCVMQENIVSSLDLKSSSGEVESYCLMWSLRPFVDDDIMQRAWELVR